MLFSLKNLFFLFFLIALNSCSNQYKNETHKLISDTIHEFDWGHPPPAYPKITNSTSLDNISAVWDSIAHDFNKKMDTLPICVSLTDTLYTLKGALDETYFSDNFLKIQNEAFSLNEIRIDLNQIENDLVVIVNKNSYKSNDCISTGSISYSRIYFDEKFSEAEFIVRFDCGFLCGNGWAVNAIKKDKKWIIVRIELIFIS